MIRCALAACLLVTSCLASSCDRNCSDDDDCAAGFACPVVPDIRECARTCTARPLRGETCSAGSDAPSCADFALPCADALVCATRGDDGSSTGTCVPSEGRVLNETCNVDEECAADLVCATTGAAGTFGGECAPATGRGTDVPCNDDAQCASGACSGGACT